MAAAKGSVEKVERVQVDGLVALKIIKHCQEEGGSSELVTGFLVGLVVGTTLEITNCFPLSKNPDEADDESQYQLDILRKLRSINLDYFQVGWYQSTYLGSHISKDFLENQVKHQLAIEESVVIIYDPLSTTRGNLRLKAFRLTPALLDMMIKNDPFTPESVQKANLHAGLLSELPVCVRSSRLDAALLTELEERDSTPSRKDFLGLSANQILQKNLQLLMEGLDSLQQETYRLIGYEKNLAKQTQQKQQFIARRKEENVRRAAREESPLPTTEEAAEQELSLKPVNPPPRLDTLMLRQQGHAHCQQIAATAGESFAKLYLAEGLQPK